MISRTPGAVSASTDSAPAICRVGGEEIRVVTWHKGSRGFKAYRDFEVLAGDELLAAAATLWLFIDLHKKRPRRIPPEWPHAYTIEGDDAVTCDLDGWQPETLPGDETFIPITLRRSDFDPHSCRLNC